MSDWQLIALALGGGILRISPIFVWAMVGDCLTQRSGHFNLGLEGIIACSAMTAVLVAGISGSPWVGVVAAAGCGAVLALVFALCCLVTRVSELGVGIAMLVGGVALARFAGSGLTYEPTTLLPTFGSGENAFAISVMLPLGLLLGGVVAWVFAATRLGLLIDAVGDRQAADGLRLLGIRTRVVRIAATMFGGGCGGIGGACLGLYYPGGWSDYLAAGVGITALTLVFLVRARPLWALVAALLFAALAAVGPALQVTFGTSTYHLFNALPYLLALGALIGSSRARRLT